MAQPDKVRGPEIRTARGNAESVSKPSQAGLLVAPTGGTSENPTPSLLLFSLGLTRRENPGSRMMVGAAPGPGRPSEHRSLHFSTQKHLAKLFSLCGERPAAASGLSNQTQREFRDLGQHAHSLPGNPQPKLRSGLALATPAPVLVLFFFLPHS